MKQLSDLKEILQTIYCIYDVYFSRFLAEHCFRVITYCPPSSCFSSRILLLTHNTTLDTLLHFGLAKFNVKINNIKTRTVGGYLLLFARVGCYVVVFYACSILLFAKNNLLTRVCKFSRTKQEFVLSTDTPIWAR